MASRAPDWIHMKFDHFLIKSQLKKGLKELQTGFMKFDHFSIKNQLKNGLKSSRLDLCEIW